MLVIYGFNASANHASVYDFIKTLFLQVLLFHFRFQIILVHVHIWLDRFNIKIRIGFRNKCDANILLLQLLCTEVQKIKPMQ